MRHWEFKTLRRYQRCQREHICFLRIMSKRSSAYFSAVFDCAADSLERFVLTDIFRWLFSLLLVYNKKIVKLLYIPVYLYLSALFRLLGSCYLSFYLHVVEETGLDHNDRRPLNSYDVTYWFYTVWKTVPESYYNRWVSHFLLASESLLITGYHSVKNLRISGP